MQLSEQARRCWETFWTDRDNIGHAQRRLIGKDIDAHIKACWESAIATAERIQQDLPHFAPTTILEVGSSAGLNCFALQRVYPDANVWGVEPERAAVDTAKAMCVDADIHSRLMFVRGYGEALPFCDGSIDLIVCHTVIEHVRDVEKVISEIARVMKPGGMLHLEAPNYVWPNEPHLDIWCLPLLGKKSVRMLGALQIQKNRLRFVEHLQFITPWRLQRCFNANGLEWENRVEKKLALVLAGNMGSVKAYRGFATVLWLLSRLGLSRLLTRIVLWSGIYPSVLYSVRRNVDA